MAIYHILTTEERLRRIQSAISDIRGAISSAKSAEKSFGNLQKQRGYVDHNPYLLEIAAKLEVSDTLITDAVSILGELIFDDTGFIFAYKWVIGKAGIDGFYFDTSATPDEITIISSTTGGVGNPFGNPVVLADNDKIIVSGTEDNDGIYTVATGPTSTAIPVDEALTLETCSNVGASITLIRRTI